MRSSFLLALAWSAASATAVAEELPTATASIEATAVQHRVDGVIEAVNQATVSSQTSGRIIELPFDVDDFVDKGEVIVRFRDTEQRARYERANASLEEARARQAEAEREFERIREIHARQLVSKAELDRAQANFDAARARLTAAQAAVREATEQLEQTVVRAPYSGIVVERHVEMGELATPGTPLMTGLSLEHLRVLAQVPQSLINDLRRDRRVQVTLPDARAIDAESLRIFPYADANTHTFRVRAELPQGQHDVYPGMLVKMTFNGAERDALVVPRAAVARRGEVSAVYLVDDEGRLHYRQVRTGREQEDRIEVLAGLDPGDRIAIDPIAATAEWKSQRASR